VRTFTYEDINADIAPMAMARLEPMHDRVWDDIARTRTTLHILPNLRALCWRSDPHSLRERSQIHQGLMLLTPGLIHLFARLPAGGDAAPGEFRSFVQNVLGRAPQLVTLDIHTSMPARRGEKDLLALLAGLTDLREVVLPGFWITSRVMESLARLPKLRLAQYELFQLDSLGDPADVASFDPQLEEGAFPALEDLSLAASVRDISRFFTTANAPTNLTHLFIHSPNILPGSSDVSTLLTDLGRVLPRLTDLYLELRKGDADSQHWQALPLTALAPLGTFRALRVFEIYCLFPLTFSMVELDAFAVALPPLEKLQLNPEPFFTLLSPQASGYPSLEALYIFARRCPQLADLGLFLHGALPSAEKDVDAPAPLAKLQSLNFGSSPMIRGPCLSGELARWLSRVCPSTCQITSGFTWDPVALGYPEPEFSQLYCTGWDEAAKLLPLVSLRSKTAPAHTSHTSPSQFASLREEEYAKRAAQEKELDDLRTRYGILMETRGSKMGLLA
jgi:hypothetical protein